VGRFLKVAALAIALTALAFLFTVGFAIWVFVPLLPAIVVYAIAVYTLRRGHTIAPPKREAESKEDHRKAA
jgi:fatty acid desaturase